MGILQLPGKNNEDNTRIKCFILSQKFFMLFQSVRDFSFSLVPVWYLPKSKNQTSPEVSHELCSLPSVGMWVDLVFSHLSQSVQSVLKLRAFYAKEKEEHLDLTYACWWCSLPLPFRQTQSVSYSFDLKTIGTSKLSSWPNRMSARTIWAIWRISQRWAS